MTRKYLTAKDFIEELLSKGWTELGVKEIYPEIWSAHTGEPPKSKENSVKNTMKEYKTAAAEVNNVVKKGKSFEEIAREHPHIWQVYSQGPPAEKEASSSVKLYNGKVPSAEVYRLQKQYMASGEAKTAAEATKLIAKREPELYEMWQRGGLN